MPTSPAYIVTGPATSNRRALVLDLIEGGLEADAPVAVYSSPNEPRDEADTRLEARPNLTRLSWQFTGEGLDWDPLPDGQRAVFLIIDGTANPVDQLELLARWLPRQPLALARILAVLHCQLLAEHPELEDWFDALIHFADVVVLNRREEVSQKFIRDYQARFEKACYPALFEMPKKGRIRNPAAVLEPQARRISLAFDQLDPIEDLDLDEDSLPEEPFNLEGKPDPWFARRENGARVKPLPNIKDFLKEA